MLIDTNVLVAALLTSGLILLIMIAIQRKLNVSSYLFYGTIILALPLSYIINTFVKIPLLNSSGLQTNASNGTLTFFEAIIWALFVGFTEEGIKFILFIVILFFIKNQREKNSTFIAYCVGIGFGIGELWYLGWPFIFPNTYELFGVGLLSWLSGFGFERFFTTFTHAAMFMVVLYGYRRNAQSSFLALLLAMIIHALVDFPILLAVIGIISPLVLSITIFLELVCGFVASFYLLDYFSRTVVDKERPTKKAELLRRAQEQ